MARSTISRTTKTAITEMRNLRQTLLLNRSRQDALVSSDKVDSDWPSEVFKISSLGLVK